MKSRFGMAKPGAAPMMEMDSDNDGAPFPPKKAAPAGKKAPFLPKKGGKPPMKGKKGC